jgi:hypothetical protein
MEKGGASMRKEPPQWVNIIVIPLLLFTIFFIIGPATILLAVLLQRFVLSQAPPWDPDRYWDGAKGYAFTGILIYIVLIVYMTIWNSQLDLELLHIVQRLTLEGLNLEAPALLHKWTAGLLLLPALSLLQERTQPRTDRSLFRILTPTEQETRTSREAKRQHQAAANEPLAQQKAIPEDRKISSTKRDAETKEEPDTPLDPTQLDKRTFWERVPDNAPMKQMAREEQERNQWLRDEAQRMGSPPTVPKKPKPQKQDKGDGSMDELL